MLLDAQCADSKSRFRGVSLKPNGVRYVGNAENRGDDQPRCNGRGDAFSEPAFSVLPAGKVRALWSCGFHVLDHLRQKSLRDGRTGGAGGIAHARVAVRLAHAEIKCSMIVGVSRGLEIVVQPM